MKSLRRLLGPRDAVVLASGTRVGWGPEPIPFARVEVRSRSKPLGTIMAAAPGPEHVLETVRSGAGIPGDLLAVSQNGSVLAGPTGLTTEVTGLERVHLTTSSYIAGSIELPGYSPPVSVIALADEQRCRAQPGAVPAPARARRARGPRFDLPLHARALAAPRPDGSTRSPRSRYRPTSIPSRASPTGEASSWPSRPSCSEARATGVRARSSDRPRRLQARERRARPCRGRRRPDRASHSESRRTLRGSDVVARSAARSSRSSSPSSISTERSPPPTACGSRWPPTC